MPGDTIDPNLTQHPSDEASTATVHDSTADAGDEADEPTDQLTGAELASRQAAADKADAAALNKILAGRGEKPVGADSAKPEPVADDSDDEDETDEDDADEPAERSKPAGKTADTSGKSADDEAAAQRLAFARANFTPEEAEHYRKTFGEKAYAAKAALFAKKQAADDRVYAQVRGQYPPAQPLSVGPTPTSPGAEASGAASSAAASVQNPASSTSDDAAIDKLLEDSFDADAATKIREVLNRSREQAKSAELARQTQRQELATSRFAVAETALSKELPSIGDPAKFTKLCEMMGKLDPDGESLADQESFNGLVKRAFYAEFGTQIQAETRASLFKDNASTRRGQLTVGQKSAPSTPGATGDFDAAVLQIVQTTRQDSPQRAKKMLALRQRWGK